MKRIVLMILVLALAAGGARLVMKRRRAVDEAPTPEPVSYAVQTVRSASRTVSRRASFLALLESRNRVQISSKLSGRILEVPVQESQEVDAGTVLVRIEDRELRSSLASLQGMLSSARQQLDYQRSNLDRNRALFEAGGLARERVEASEVAFAAAEAAVQDLVQKVRGLESQLAYTVIRAPFAGTVGTILLHAGDLAVPGRPLLTLNGGRRKLTFRFAPEGEEVAIGQEVFVAGRRIGTVALLHDDARAGLAVAEVHPEVSLDLPVGSYLTLQVQTRTATGCSLPVRTLLHRSRGVSVMVYRGGRFVEQPVRVAVRDRRFALIEPCVTEPVGMAAEAKLSLLPALGRVRIITPEGI